MISLDLSKNNRGILLLEGDKIVVIEAIPNDLSYDIWLSSDKIVRINVLWQGDIGEFARSGASGLEETQEFIDEIVLLALEKSPGKPSKYFNVLEDNLACMMESIIIILKKEDDLFKIDFWGSRIDLETVLLKEFEKIRMTDFLIKNNRYDKMHNIWYNSYNISKNKNYFIQLDGDINTRNEKGLLKEQYHSCLESAIKQVSLWYPDPEDDRVLIFNIQRDEPELSWGFWGSHWEIPEGHEQGQFPEGWPNPWEEY